MCSRWEIVATLNLALLVAWTDSTGSQSVHVNPTKVYAITGDSINLTCHHPFNSNATVLWNKGPFYQENRISGVTEPTILTAGSVFQIHHFNASRHAGQYTCSVEGPKKEKIISCPSELVLAFTDFRQVIQPEDVIACAGSTVVFHCNAVLSVPRVRITWTHNGQSLTDSGITLMPSGNLYILSVDTSKTGSYQCIATNPVTLDHWRSMEATLTVLERTGNETYSAPSFVVEPQDTAAMEGSTVVLECAGHGNPQPTVTWRKVGSSMLPEGSLLHSTGALIINNVSRAHLGSYVCKLGENAATRLEMQEKQVNLTITGNPDFEQTFVFAEDGVSKRSGLVCVSRANGLLEGECQQNLYLLYNGTVIDQTAGDITASITHFFNDSTNTTTTRLFQCMSVTPGGCAVMDIQASYTDGIITTIKNYTLRNVPTSASCEVSTLQPMTSTITTLPKNALTTETSATTLPTCDSNFRGGVEPTLNVNIQYSMTCAAVGSPATSTCEVTGPGTGSVHVTWLYNGTRDILAQPLENVTVDLRSSKHGSVAKITADLVIKSVNFGHAGMYVCSAHSNCPSMHASSSISLSVKPAETSISSDTSTGETITLPIQTTESGRSTKDTTSIAATEQVITDSSSTVTPSRPSRRPVHLNATVHPITTDVHLYWDYPDSASISGIKINWDTADRISISARHVVDANAFQFTIPSSLYNSSLVLVVHVWAYNGYGDGPYSTVIINPLEGTAATTSSVSVTSVSSNSVTSDATLNTILKCIAMAKNPTTVELSWPDFLSVNDSSVQLITSCEEGNTLLSTSISSSPSSYVISRALPSCTYTFELQFLRHIAVCKVVTPVGQVDLGVNVTRFPNGSAALHFHLPPEVHDDPDLLVEVNWGEGWSPVSTSHIPSYFDPSKEYQVEFRLRLGKWEGYVNITVPSVTHSEPEQEGGNSITDVVLLYCIIFGTLLITCTVLLAIVLGLKYVQWSHRESDKITDFREKSRQKFFKDRAEKSSIKSNTSDNSTSV